MAANTLSIVDMIKVLYPTLYSIHDLPPDVGDEPPPPPSQANAEQPNEYLDPQTGEERVYRAGGAPRPGVDVPVGLPPTSEKLSSQGVFLLDSGEDLLMYVGRGTSAEVLQELFGVATPPEGEKSSRAIFALCFLLLHGGDVNLERLCQVFSEQGCRIFTDSLSFPDESVSRRPSSSRMDRRCWCCCM